MSEANNPQASGTSFAVWKHIGHIRNFGEIIHPMLPMIYHTGFNAI
jgi:hypothetical protein